MTSNKEIDSSIGDMGKETLRIAIEAFYDPWNLISTLSTILDEEAIKYARRTGDYDRATTMLTISGALDRLEDEWN